MICRSGLSTLLTILDQWNEASWGTTRQIPETRHRIPNPEPRSPAAELRNLDTERQTSGGRIGNRLVYVVDGVRVVGYDNERGKGDHRHIGGREVVYRFVDVPTLLKDFLKDVGTV